MALLLLESWDRYGGDTTQAHRDWSPTITLSSTHPKAGTYSLGNGSGQANSRVLAITATTVYFGLWVYWTTGTQPAQNGVCLGFFSSGTSYSGFNAVCALNITTLGQLKVTRTFNPGTALGTSTACLVNGQQNYIECKFVFGASGSYIVRCNGVEVLNSSGDMGGTTIAGIHCGNNTSYWMDSLWMLDNTGSAPYNTFLGEYVVNGFNASMGNGANIGLTPSSGLDHGSLVDEAIANDDTDYNGGAAGLKDTYIINTSALAGQTIRGVQVSLCTKGTTAGTNSVAAVVRISGVDYDGGTIVITTSYDYYYQIWGARPSDSTEWTQGNITQLGMKVVAAAGTVRLTQIFVEVLSTAPVTPPTDVPVTTFAGVLAPLKRGTLDISEVSNGRNTLTCEVVSTGSYRPAVDEEVIVMLNSVRIFGGTIDKTTERGAGDVGLSNLLIRVNVNDFNSLADRRYINNAFAAGTLKSILTTLVGYLASLGVNLDPAQVTGPSLDALVYDYKQATEILNDLATLTGYVWEIDYDKLLRMYQPGTVAAPFNIVTGNGRPLHDIQVDQNARTSYANRIILRAGSGVAQKTETFTGDGSTYSFALTYQFSSAGQWVSNNGAQESFTLQGIGFDLAVQWLYYSVDNTIRRETSGTPDAPANGNTIIFSYLAQFPFTVIAEDTADQAIHGVLDRLVEYPDVFDLAVAQALADQELAHGLERLTTVRYVTRGIGLKPGQTQTITVTTRGINASYLITDVHSHDDADGVLRRQITAVQGTTLRPTWREVYKQWSGIGGPTTPVT